MNLPFRKFAFYILLIQYFYSVNANNNGYAYVVENENYGYTCTAVSYKNEKPEEENEWTSCSAKCSSSQKSNYLGCPTVMVDVRESGRTFRLEECEDVQFVKCPSISSQALECFRGDCQNKNVLFECTTYPEFNMVKDSTYGAICRDLSSVLKCEAENYGPTVSCGAVNNCLTLQGKYKYENGDCEKLLDPYKCERICDEELEIGGKEKLIIVRQLDGMFSASCARAYDPTITAGNGTWLPNFSTLAEPGSKTPNMIVFCSNIQQSKDDGNIWDFSDCFNGTLVEPEYFENDKVGIESLTQAHGQLMAEGIEEGRDYKIIGPTEISLMIQANTKLYVNEEGCTNSSEECRDFISKYGHSYEAGNNYKNFLISNFDCNANCLAQSLIFDVALDFISSDHNFLNL